MKSTKAMILSAVLHQEKPFKAAKIFNATGIGRSLVQYHLGSLINEGALEKNGMYYAIADRDALINAVGDLEEDSRLKKPKGNLIVFEVLASLQAVKHPVAKDAKRLLLDYYDKEISDLKVRRKYAAQHMKNPKPAQRILKDVDRAWDVITAIGGVDELIGETEFKEILKELLEEE